MYLSVIPSRGLSEPAFQRTQLARHLREEGVHSSRDAARLGPEGTLEEVEERYRHCTHLCQQARPEELAIAQDPDSLVVDALWEDKA